MTDEPRELTEDELEEQNGELLPEREQMSLIDGSGPITGLGPIAGHYTIPIEPPNPVE